VEDIRFDDGCLRCMGKGRKERLVPLGESARAYLRRYIDEVRPRAPAARRRARSS
jgi:integrase/recombinase XerD